MSVAVPHEVYTSKALCFYWPSLPACKCLFSSAHRIVDCSPWSTENWRWQLQQVLMGCHRPHLAIRSVPIPHPFKPNHCPVFLAERCYEALFIFSRVAIWMNITQTQQTDLCAQCFLLYDFCGNFLYTPVRIYLAFFKCTASFWCVCQQQQWWGQKPSIQVCSTTLLSRGL